MVLISIDGRSGSFRSSKAGGWLRGTSVRPEQRTELWSVAGAADHYGERRIFPRTFCGRDGLISGLHVVCPDQNKSVKLTRHWVSASNQASGMDSEPLSLQKMAGTTAKRHRRNWIRGSGYRLLTAYNK